MKKIFTLFLVVAAVAACLYFFFGRENKALVTSAAFLPEDVLVCFTQKDLGKILDDFKESRLGKTLAPIDVVQIAEEMQLPEEQKRMIKNTREEVDAFLKGPIFKEIFSNEFSVALLPFESANLEILSGIESHLLLIARPQHGTQIISLLTSGFGSALNQTETSYGRHSIKHFQLDQQKTLVAAAVHDLILMSLDERIIHDALDRYDGKKKALDDTDGYRKLKASFADPVFFSYLGIESLKRQVEELIEKTESRQRALITEQLKKWDGLQVAGYGVWREIDKIRDKGVFIVDNEKLDPALKRFYGISPEKNPTLAFVPQHVMAYYWTNTFDLEAYWKMYLEGAGRNGQKMGGVRDTVKKQAGMDIESIFGLLDKQCGLIIKEGNTKRILPIPDFSIFLRLKDSRQFAELARNAFKNKGLQMKTQNYKGVEIMSLAGFSDGGLLPAYAIHDQYVFVASSLAMIKEVIDTGKDGHGLVDDAGFQKVDTNLQGDNNSVAYIRVGDLMRWGKGLIGWGRNFITIQDNEGAKKTEVLLDRLVNPLLDGLSMYTAWGMRSHIALNQITFESTVIIEK